MKNVITTYIPDANEQSLGCKSVTYNRNVCTALYELDDNEECNQIIISGIPIDIFHDFSSKIFNLGFSLKLDTVTTNLKFTNNFICFLDKENGTVEFFEDYMKFGRTKSLGRTLSSQNNPITIEILECEYELFKSYSECQLT